MHTAHAADKTLPDRLADELIARIFTGELKPGELLPPERALAVELGVDRTSLRMALRQLTRLKVTSPLRGSGIRVLDYRRHAGLDFFAAVLEVPGLSLGGVLLIEFLDHWIATMPALIAQAFVRATPADIARLDTVFAQQLALLDAGGELEELADLEVQIQDGIAALVGSTAIDMITNSTRALRRTLGRLQLKLVDPRQQVLMQRAQVRALLAVRPAPEQIVSNVRLFLSEHSKALRAHLASLPSNPSRSQRWSPPIHGSLRAKGGT
jgi:DNA-binding FadR family transcriptional regulator